MKSFIEYLSLYEDDPRLVKKHTMSIQRRLGEARISSARTIQVKKANIKKIQAEFLKHLPRGFKEAGAGAGRFWMHNPGTGHEIEIKITDVTPKGKTQKV